MHLGIFGIWQHTKAEKVFWSTTKPKPLIFANYRRVDNQGDFWDIFIDKSQFWKNTILEPKKDTGNVVLW